MPDTMFPFPMKPLQLAVNSPPMTILQTPAKHVHVGQRVLQQKLASMSRTNQAAHKKVDCREISFGCKLLFPFVLSALNIKNTLLDFICSN